MLWIPVLLACCSASRAEGLAYEIRRAESIAGRGNAPVDDDTLVAWLRLAEVERLFLWLPAGTASDLPDEPRAVPFPSRPELAELAPLALACERAGVALAVGRAAANEWTFPTVFLQAERIRTYRRMSRPGVRTRAWYDPEFLQDSAAAAASGAGLSVTASLVAELPEPLRALQAFLDLAAAIHRGRANPADQLSHLLAALPVAAREPLQPLGDDSVLRALRQQSELFSAVADRIGGPLPHQLLVETNEWTGGVLQVRDARPLRRAPPALDLEEWVCSESAAAGRPSLSDALQQVRPPGLGLAPEPAPEDGVDEPPFPWLMPATERRVWREAAELCSEASWLLLRFLVFGEAESQAACRRLLMRLETHPVGAGWSLTRSEDAARLDAVEPLRMERLEFEVWVGDQHLADRSTLHLDDARLGGFFESLARRQAWNSLDLSALVASEQPPSLRLITHLPLPDARTVRLQIDGPYDLVLMANEEIRGRRSSALPRNPLVASLALLPGRNRLQIDCKPVEFVGPLRVEFLRLPRRFEGTTFVPENADAFQPPVANLNHPLALGESVLALPDARYDSRAPAGHADFFFENPAARRVDFWFHGLADLPTDGTFALEVDEGRRFGARLPPGAGWQWLRIESPVTLDKGSHRLRVHLWQPGILIDALTVMEAGLRFPGSPPGDRSLHDFAWRFDPLGTGNVLHFSRRLGTIESFRTFQLGKSGSYQLYAWLQSAAGGPAPGRAYVRLETIRGNHDVSIPEETPREQWVAVGNVSVTADETIRVHASGETLLALALVP